MTITNNNPYTRWFEDISIKDIPSVGGKNASLGEMMRSLKNQGIKFQMVLLRDMESRA